MGSTTTSCAICGNDRIEINSAFAQLPRVTSDCRPFPPGGKIGFCPACGAVQKPADACWRAESASIYARYDMFRQATDRAEQLVFDQITGTSIPRSVLVLSRLNEVHSFADSGRALDVGCGTGPMVRALAAFAPGWDLFGHEISDANSDILAAIPGFRRLFTGDLADIPESFDLITLSQSLEHFADPVAALAVLRRKLAPGGKLLVEVPNVRANVYDLLVADHRCHFDTRSLAAVAGRAKFRHAGVVDHWVFKELTMVASDSPLTIAPVSDAAAPWTADGLDRRISWLGSLMRAAADTANSAENFGVFGTSIAGTWLFGSLQERIGFFVDEDTARIGRCHEGRPILAPAEVPKGSSVFVPLVPGVAERVASRLSALGIKAEVPPAHHG